MKKIIAIVIIVLVCFSIGFMLVAGMEYRGGYVFSEDFSKIAVSFYGDPSSSRGFSFFTESEEYKDICNVQLDPADTEQTSPNFRDSDNIILDAVSHFTQYISPRQLRHYTMVDDLEPGTKYFYRVGSEEKNAWSPWGYFTTDNNDSIFEFLHITDSQAKNEEEFEAYADSLSKAFEVSGIPDFVFTTGDLVETGLFSTEWDLFFEKTQDMMMKTTFVPASGNHEIIPPPINYHFYLDNISSSTTSRVQYAYEYGNALFVILDTNDLSLTSQISWLEDVLSNSDKEFKIVGFHKAPFSSGNHAEQSDIMKIRDILVPVLSEYQVDLVLNGHDHIYCRTYPLIDKEIGNWDSRTETEVDGVTKITYNNPEGVIYSINRAIGAKFYNKSKDLNDHLIEVGDPKKPDKPVFSKVIIENNTLNYISYEHDRGGTDEVTIIDWFEIVK